MLATFNIKTMCGKEVEVEAFTYSQAITIWKASKPSELFKSCQLVKSSKERDRYYELRDLSNQSKNDLNEIELIVDNFRELALYKQYKKFQSFKREPRNGD